MSSYILCWKLGTGQAISCDPVSKNFSWNGRLSPFICRPSLAHGSLCQVVDGLCLKSSIVRGSTPLSSASLSRPTDNVVFWVWLCWTLRLWSRGRKSQTQYTDDYKLMSHTGVKDCFPHRAGWVLLLLSVGLWFWTLRPTAVRIKVPDLHTTHCLNISILNITFHLHAQR